MGLHANKLTAGDRLTLKILDKDFSVDRRGRFYADIHVNPWVAIPFLTRILYGRGRPPEGCWVPSPVFDKP